MPHSEPDAKDTLEEAEAYYAHAYAVEESSPVHSTVVAMAQRMAHDLQADEDLVWAALGATSTLEPSSRNSNSTSSNSTSSSSSSNKRRIYHEDQARLVVQQELKRLAQVPDDSPALAQLIEEGFDPFLARRALALTDSNLPNARAILHAEWDNNNIEEEEEMEKEEKQATAAAAARQQPSQVSSEEPKKQPEEEEENEEPERPTPLMQTVEVQTNFDPTKMDDRASSSVRSTLPISSSKASPLPAAGGASSSSSSPPQPAHKADVVFEATAAHIHELVLESPVPVLLDVYADWCGPCKVLGPALEEMAMKSGGLFRLVKVNADHEKAIASTALEVTALPTVFGIKDGHIKNIFQGMPRSQEAMQSFMAGLLMGDDAHFQPPLTDQDKQKFAELTSKLIKVASSAAFPFSARERLQDRINARLEELVKQSKDFVEAEEAALTVRALLVNIIKDPYSLKFRTINLANKVVAAKVAKFPAGMALLKSLGFHVASHGDTATLGATKKIVNIAPLMVARDCIDQWIDKSRPELARAMRKRKDEEERERLQRERPERDDEQDESDEEEEDVDPDACFLKVRLDGKKKVHELSLRADDTLSTVLAQLPEDWSSASDDIQITCVAKRLVAKASDSDIMSQSLRELGLVPTALLVVKVGANHMATTGGLADRAKSKKKKKKGSHTMQSVGIYSKDDNAKAELIDGGGGTWYEHDVSDDEAADEPKTEVEAEAAAEEKAEAEADDENDKDDDEEEVYDENEEEEEADDQEE